MSARLQRHPFGLTWTEEGGMVRSAHALASGGQVWLVDPFDDEPALTAAAGLGQLAGVVQLLDRHNRDCELLANRLGVPLQRLPGRLPDTPFEFEAIVSRGRWREIALWWPEESALVVAEAVGTAPAFALGRRVGVHPLLRLAPPRAQLSRHHPERLLVGHGEAIESDGAGALSEALEHSRSDIPRLLVKLPTLLRGV